MGRITPYKEYAMCIGVLCSRIRVEEKLIFAELAAQGKRSGL